MCADVTAAIANWGTEALQFINVDYTLTLSRLPEGPHIGLAALTHYSDDGVANGSAVSWTTRARSAARCLSRSRTLDFVRRTAGLRIATCRTKDVLDVDRRRGTARTEPVGFSPMTMAAA